LREHTESEFVAPIAAERNIGHMDIAIILDDFLTIASKAGRSIVFDYLGQTFQISVARSNSEREFQDPWTEETVSIKRESIWIKHLKTDAKFSISPIDLYGFANYGVLPPSYHGKDFFEVFDKKFVDDRRAFAAQHGIDATTPCGELFVNHFRGLNLSW
jgi:hypothetical protein